MLRARIAAVCVLGSAACALPHAELRSDGGSGADIVAMPDVVQPDRVVPGPDVIDDVVSVDVACPLAQTRCAGGCVDTQTDANNCGTCGMACGAGNECVGGACRMICAAPRRTCGGACVDVQSDATNCGACGMICAAGQRCSSGGCTATCLLTECGASCVDTQMSPDHCGGCNQPCPAAQMCRAGVCACPGTGQMLCGGACVNTQTDNNNCGACGTVCSGGATCMAGVCRCSTGQHRCGAACVPETSITQCGTSCMTCPAPPANATANCTAGSCGFTCNSGYAPQGGGCVLSCAANQHVCNNACVSNSSVTSCGPTSCTACPSPGANGMPTCNGTSCGIACNSPFVANGTGCVCPAGQHACGSTCVPNTSITQCGISCMMCPMPPANAHAVCAAGSCTSECNAGFVMTPMGCSMSSSGGPCGNGVIDGLETCDDGRTPAVGGDGCSATCQIEADVVRESCGATPAEMTIRNGQTIVLRGTTAGRGDNGSGSCSASGPDVVVRVRAVDGGNFRAVLTPRAPLWDVIIRTGGACPGTTCVDSPGGPVPETYTQNGVSAGTIIDLVVDGFSGASGPFELTLSLL